MPRRPKKAGVADAEDTALIDWHEPDRNTHLLDWRARAREFGVVPVEQADPGPSHAFEPPEQLIEEEEPEAYAEQRVDGAAEEVDEPVRLEEAEEATLPADEVDLVRLYFQHIGRRKLLKREQEQEICRNIEAKRAELLSTVGAIPAATLSLLALADQVRGGTALAAELILLPDGGELTKKKIDPVLESLVKVKRLERKVEALRRQCDEARLSVTARAKAQADIERTQKNIGGLLAQLPIRPSLIDDVVTELGRVNAEFEAASRQPRNAERAQSIAALERQAGLPRKVFVQSLQPGAREAGSTDRSEARAAGSEPAARRLDCQTLCWSRAVAPRPDPGREHRPHEGGRPVPVSARVQILDVRDVVGASGHYAIARGLRPHDPAAGSCHRIAQPSES